MLFYFFNGRNALATSRHFAISRQTFYRWKRPFDRHVLATLEACSHRPRHIRKPTWTTVLAQRVLSPRQQYPCRGKDKLAVLLPRQNCTASVSMVGRILVDLKTRGVLHEPSRPAVLREQWRKLQNHPCAVRKPKHRRIQQTGDLVAPVREYLQPHPATSVPGLTHSIGIHHPLEAQPTKGNEYKWFH